MTSPWLDWCMCGTAHERDYVSHRLPCGRFNQWSVPVSGADIANAVANYHGQNKGRPLGLIRWNIAFGRRIGTRA